MALGIPRNISDMDERPLSKPETLEEAVERLVIMLDIIETVMQQVQKIVASALFNL